MKKLRSCLSLSVVLIICIFAFTAQTTAFADAVPQRAYVGGFPVGISLDVGGLLVEEVTGVETEYGSATVEGLEKGDIITKIDGNAVSSADDIPDEFDGEVSVELIRGGQVMNVVITPLVEEYSRKPRLGVKVKDKLYGIGTVTFVGENGEYAALGHEIYDSETGTHIPFGGGHIHECKLLGIKRGSAGEAGALLASLASDVVIGTVTCNNSFGIAGAFSDMPECGELLEVADRSEVKPGKAQIRTTVERDAEYYDIEIIKASQKSGRREKSLVFRVTDKRLLSSTGGIVRGMSGSPIVQNGKIVGAVTHVFLNDFTKGYGLYADSLNAA